MKLLTVPVLLLSILLANDLPMVFATQQGTAAERAASLRSQISDIEGKQADLQTRLQQLEESLKPENIESSLAGTGSTHPEELREQRRRQLDIERTAVRSQLDQLAISHSRLETALTQSDADAYRQSALPSTGPSPPTALQQVPGNEAAKQPTSKKKKTRKFRKRHPARA